eukprot:11202410-Lingulodinium_polyedra.AAC.1
MSWNWKNGKSWGSTGGDHWGGGNGPETGGRRKTTPPTQRRDPETGGLARAYRCPRDCAAGRLYNLRRVPQKPDRSE